MVILFTPIVQAQGRLISFAFNPVVPIVLENKHGRKVFPNLDYQ